MWFVVVCGVLWCLVQPIMLNFWQGVYMERAGNLVLLFLFVFHSDLLILPNLEIG